MAGNSNCQLSINMEERAVEEEQEEEEEVVQEAEQEEEEEEEASAAQVLAALQRAWQDERCAPELLPHRQELVEGMLGQVQHMERHAGRLAASELRRLLHEAELARIKFLVGSYLRCRLRKLETHCGALLALPGELLRVRLAPAELRYAAEHARLQLAHAALALAGAPDNMRQLDAARLARAPDLDAHVFLRANQTVNGVVVEGVTPDQDEEIDLEEGSQHILQYRPIAELVKSGKVQLI